MSRFRMLVSAVGATAVVAGVTAGAGGLALAAPKPAETVLAGSAVSFTSHTRATGDLAGSTRLSIQLWLRPQTAAASRFATEVSTPGGALYHHYLSPDAYTARFGATRAEASRAGSWLRSQGFTGIQTGSERSYVRATAATSKIDAAFRTRIQTYAPSAAVNAGRYLLRANSRALSLPTSLASSVLGVTGIDNAAPILPLDRVATKPAGESSTPRAGAPVAPCSQFYGQHTVSGLPEQFGTTTFPTEGCGYTADQLRAAYGANPANRGKGQTVALVELGLTKDMFLTLADYAAANSMPQPSPSRYEELSLGKNDCGDPFNVEEQLDVESSYDMAPGAHQIVVGGDGCNAGDFGLQGLFDADLAVLGSGGHPLATLASNSWEGGLESQPAQLTNIEHAYLVRAAAEGVGMYFSAGDGSGVLSPSDDPFSIAVGGTSLGLGQSGNRLFETGWSTGVSVLRSHQWLLSGEQGAAGGGPSLLFKQPAYQKGVVPAALSKVAGNRGGPVRSIPDISAVADPFTGFAVGLLSFPKGGGKPAFSESDIGGTSLAAPVVAGIVTSAQQGEPAPFGFVNPDLYKLHGTSAYNDALPLTKSSPSLFDGTFCDAVTCGANVLTTFDDQSPLMTGYNGQVTLPGYDNMTGIGTPNGQNFITALRGLG